MLAVRTPGAPQTARGDAGCGSAFPFERQGRPLRSRSISGLFSRSLYSGLQPPCLRFAAAVTGRHARLGTRLLARLCRDRHLRRQTSTRLQGATLTKPDVRRSPHPASTFQPTVGYQSATDTGGSGLAARAVPANVLRRFFDIANACISVSPIGREPR